MKNILKLHYVKFEEALFGSDCDMTHLLGDYSFTLGGIEQDFQYIYFVYVFIISLSENVVRPTKSVLSLLCSFSCGSLYYILHYDWVLLHMLKYYGARQNCITHSSS